MQSSTGQWASQMGEPAQLEQFSFITARSAVPLRFFASAIRFDPSFHEPPSKGDNHRRRQQHPPITNQSYSAPLEPVNKVWRARNERAQRLLCSGVIMRFAHRLRNAVKRTVVLRIELQSRLEITACLGPFVLFG